MKVFVWSRVEKCSDFYHGEGGVVVFADDEDAARALANAIYGCAIKPDEAPDEVRECLEGGPAVYIMPDAGCCG